MWLSLFSYKLQMMKTFLFSIPQRLKLKSEELDVQAVLCHKAWSVFNDEGVTQLFIFQPDGTLYVTTNGNVTFSSWIYVPANKTLIITSGGRSSMFHPAFLDDGVFALQKDGEGTLLFMIDEKNEPVFMPKTLAELGAYFDRKERALIERERERKEEAEKQALVLKEAKEFGEFVEIIVNDLSVRKKDEKFFINVGKISLAGPFERVFSDSLYLDRFVSAYGEGKLSVFFWDGQRTSLQLCYTWSGPSNMNHRFSSNPWKKEDKPIPEVSGSVGRMVNGDYCLDILREVGVCRIYRIVEHEIIDPHNDPYPRKRRIKSILQVVLYYVVLVALLILFFLHFGEMFESIGDFITSILLLSLDIFGLAWGMTLYDRLKERYYNDLPLRLRFSKVVWTNEIKGDWRAPLQY